MHSGVILLSRRRCKAILTTAPIHETKYCRRRREESLISCLSPNNETPHVVSYRFVNWPCSYEPARDSRLLTRFGLPASFGPLFHPRSASTRTGLASTPPDLGCSPLAAASQIPLIAACLRLNLRGGV